MAIREAKGFSRKDIAEKIDVSEKKYAAFELKSYVMQEPNFEELCTILEINPNDYLNEYFVAPVFTDVYSFVGERIQQVREENEMSQTKLATLVGVTRQAINNYERGIREPDLLILSQIALIFNVSTDYLLGLAHETDHSRERLGHMMEETLKKAEVYDKKLQKTFSRLTLCEIGLLSEMLYEFSHSNLLELIKYARHIKFDNENPMDWDGRKS